MQETYSFLCLGDSYTIGESVPLHHNFPYQTVQLLRKAAIPFAAPEIVAKTAWTTAELLQAIDERILPPAFDYTTLLIGVNDQYRGLSVQNFKENLFALIETALSFVETPQHCILLSIPDYGVTPFAADKNPSKISVELETFNEIIETAAKDYQTHFINITPLTQMAATDLSLLAEDGLHPSGNLYMQWATLVSNYITNQINNHSTD
ncbi:SGNH/GDSL hydrolase family protein [Gynurincola endophyticus]|jgi:lysophospholipase L1-like esterase|uniref:SGNH/GDSL hydrolase family protein n=1 Tax=Gynurincola endophyticus TaxID=2479004 RepID=UPI000F8D939D|nr:GDSL-type esterase/lipase family protein [Gynurincola endophyticus]